MLQNSNTFNSKVMSNSVSNSTSSAKAPVSSHSSAVSSSSHSNNLAPAKPKQPTNNAKGGLVPLRDRTKIHDVNNNARDIYITEPNGKHIYAQLQAPSFKEARAISSSQYSIKPNGTNTGVMKIDSVDYDEHLFNMFHNLTVNNAPAGHISWKFLNKQDFTTSSWLMRQAASFLTHIFNANN